MSTSACASKPVNPPTAASLVDNGGDDDGDNGDALETSPWGAKGGEADDKDDGMEGDEDNGVDEEKTTSVSKGKL